MQILILHTPKGGSGKSTLAREMAVAASRTMQVALADLDPQGTTSGWYQRRDAKTPALVTLDPAKPVHHLADAGIELLVIDTPPGQPAAAAITGQAASEFSGKAADEAVALWAYVQSILGAADVATSEGKSGRSDGAKGRRASRGGGAG